ncbi:LysM peptidoglycan-binding domain-containing protein [Ktedonobacter racemifer]|uniref:Peptidoglycan-binding lysin domain protein n=1 Tax=Ktedonobacter racemifer DSM 44963 TaxID=485913 RepID=D6U1R8_KTERA|nr:LysM domain-containing protein [Ktedonobacter racemifer]EFH82712.1 Peptidoglycan-binding lysin domain protein [Ktedonobacter racemifer DSM 44963]
MWKWSLAGITLVMALLLLAVASPAVHAASGKKGSVSRPAVHAASGKKGPVSRPAVHAASGKKGSVSRPAVHAASGKKGSVSRPVAHSIARGRSVTQSSLSSTSTLASTHGNRATRSRSGTYVVGPKDSLWVIAARFYGSGQQWQRLYQNNRSIIGSDPRMIHPGQRLVLLQ